MTVITKRDLENRQLKQQQELEQMHKLSEMRNRKAESSGSMYLTK